jgi:hypothetical protein
MSAYATHERYSKPAIFHAAANDVSRAAKRIYTRTFAS